MQLLENLVSVLARSLLTASASAEPESGGVSFQPCRATPAAVAQAVDERMLDREDSLLPSWCRRRETPRLSHERVIEFAKIDLYERGLQLQVLAQAAKRHPGSSRWIARHRAQTLSRGHDPSRGHVLVPTLGVTDTHSLSGHALAESSGSNSRHSIGSSMGDKDIVLLRLGNCRWLSLPAGIHGRVTRNRGEINTRRSCRRHRSKLRNVRNADPSAVTQTPCMGDDVKAPCTRHDKVVGTAGNQASSTVVREVPSALKGREV